MKAYNFPEKNLQKTLVIISCLFLKPFSSYIIYPCHCSVDFWKWYTCSEHFENNWTVSLDSKLQSNYFCVHLHLPFQIKAETCEYILFPLLSHIPIVQKLSPKPFFFFFFTIPGFLNKITYWRPCSVYKNIFSKPDLNMKGKNFKNLFKNSLLSHFAYAIFLLLLTLLAISSFSVLLYSYWKCKC